MLRTKQTVAVEVSATIERIGEESGLHAVETISVDSVRWPALPRSEDVSNRAAEERREENALRVRGRHADEVNVRVQRPRSHVADVIAGELSALANLMVQIERAVVGDGIKSEIPTAKDVRGDQVGTRCEAHVV